MCLVTGGLEILAQQRHRPAVKLTRGDDGGWPRRQSKHCGVQRGHSRGCGDTSFGAFELDIFGVTGANRVDLAKILDVGDRRRLVAGQIQQ